MELSFTFRHTSSSDSIKDYVEKKIGTLKRHVPEPASCHVTFSHEKFRYSAEVILEAHGATFKAKKEDSNMNSAFDSALDVLKVQVRKFRDRIKER